MPQEVPDREAAAIIEGEGRSHRVSWNLGCSLTGDEGIEACKKRERRVQGGVGVEEDIKRENSELIDVGRTDRNGIRRRIERREIKNSTLNDSKSVHVYLLFAQFLIIFWSYATATAVDGVGSVSIPYNVDDNGLSPEVAYISSDDKVPLASTASHTLTSHNSPLTSSSSSLSRLKEDDFKENYVKASALEATSTNRPPNSVTVSDVTATTGQILTRLSNSVTAGGKISTPSQSLCQKAEIWPKDVGDKFLDIGYLHTQLGNRIERLGLKIPGAFSYAVDVVNSGARLPEGYKLRTNVSDIGIPLYGCI